MDNETTTAVRAMTLEHPISPCFERGDTVLLNAVDPIMDTDWILLQAPDGTLRCEQGSALAQGQHYLGVLVGYYRGHAPNH